MDHGQTMDPEGVETGVVHDLVDFKGKEILEIGCGTGRLTFRIAEGAKSVLAIDPDEDSIEVARERTPSKLRSRVAFMPTSITDVVLADNAFDIAVLSWSI
jgi:ubiquinone/menaquinone biosynthesis C-methylase UbiE